MSEQSRVEDLLKTGVEEPVLPMSRLEAILRGEKITPMSRVEELLLQYNPSDILIEKRITANGTYFAVNDQADGYFKVVVDTPVVPPTVLDHLVETITTNGLHEYTPTHDGFDTAAITVAVPIPPEKVLGTKTITENGTYDASDDSTEVTVTLDNPSIPDNSFIHVDILDIADVTKIIGKVRYTNASTDRAFTVDISNIPTYTPSGSNPYRNMYRFDSYNASVGLYISKDATGIFLYNMNGGWVRPVIYEFGYKETKQLDGYSEVTVNVPGGNSLLYLGYGEQTAIDSNWAYGILPIDTINKSSNFDDYLEYDASTKYFTCKLGFDALIVFWVYNLHSSDNRPQVILNDSNNSTIESITTNSTSAGAKGGSGIIVRMSAGYRFKFVNPEEKGWGFVRAKFYKVVDTTVYDFNEP